MEIWYKFFSHARFNIFIMFIVSDKEYIIERTKIFEEQLVASTESFVSTTYDLINTHALISAY